MQPSLFKFGDRGYRGLFGFALSTSFLRPQVTVTGLKSSWISTTGKKPSVRVPGEATPIKLWAYAFHGTRTWGQVNGLPSFKARRSTTALLVYHLLYSDQHMWCIPKDLLGNIP
jgi:hypothetical protein